MAELCLKNIYEDEELDRLSTTDFMVTFCVAVCFGLMYNGTDKSGFTGILQNGLYKDTI